MGARWNGLDKRYACDGTGEGESMRDKGQKGNSQNKRTARVRNGYDCTWGAAKPGSHKGNHLLANVGDRR